MELNKIGLVKLLRLINYDQLWSYSSAPCRYYPCFRLTLHLRRWLQLSQHHMGLHFNQPRRRRTRGLGLSIRCPTFIWPQATRQLSLRKVEHYLKPQSCIRKSQRSLTSSHYPGSLSYRSQHRPSLITPDNPIKPIPTKPVKRWNFRKARWDQFTNLVDSGTDSLPPPTSSDPDLAYSAFCKLIIRAAKKAIPHGFRHRYKMYIPNWDEECDIHYNKFLHAEPGDEAAAKASDLTDCLDKKRRERWEETVQGIDFTHSSRMAWKTFNRLTGRSSRPTQCPVSANSIAEQLLANGRLKDPAKDHTRFHQARNHKTMASPRSRRLPVNTLHIWRALHCHRSTEEWESPGARQHPARVLATLRPKMPELAQGVLFLLPQ